MGWAWITPPVDALKAMAPSMKKSRRKTLLAEETVRVMRLLYPGADCELNYSSALDLLIATILSAQSTDAQINIVTETLFRKYRTAQDYAAADPAVLEQEIRSTGFFRNKARAVIATGMMIVEEFGGEVPDTMDELVRLPGVARKTANVVLGTFFGKPEGFVVDTHVQRVAMRLGLTDQTNPVAVEAALMDLFPRSEWIFLGHALIWHGRRLCKARRPRCPDCPLQSHCAKIGVPE